MADRRNMQELDDHTINLMEIDCLKVLKFIASDVFQPKIIKLIICIHIFIHVFISLFGLYCVVYVLDTKEIIYNATALCGILYCLVGMMLLVIKPRLVQDLKKEIPIWAIDSADAKIHKRIKMEIIIVTTFAVIQFIVVILTCFLVINPLKHDREFFIAIRIFEDYFPSYRKTLMFIYKCTFPLTGYSMVVHAFQLLYLLQQMRFQLYMYIERCKNIGNFSQNSNEGELFYDENYQNIVHKRMIFCIERHIEFIEFSIKKNREIRILIAIFSICGSLLAMSIFIYVFTKQFYKEYYVRIGFLGLITCITFLILIVPGQLCENEVEEAEAVVNHEIPWYNFNAKNKRTYLIFLINIMKERKIRFSENYSINYQLGVAIIKTIYSTGVVFINMMK